MIAALAVVGLLMPLLGWSPSQAGSAVAGATFAADPGEKIAAGLQRKFQRSDGDPQDFWVSFDQAADTGGAREIEDWAERGRHVVDRLRETANESQADTIELLDAAGVDYTAFWISNAIRVESGDYALAHSLAAQPEVERVFAPTTYEQPDPVKQKLTGSRLGPNAEAAAEWGIQNIKADQVWEQYGVRGDGIVVANVDTGVQFDHPALVESYRGNNGDGTFSNDYNWFDPTGQYAFPTDLNGHGTHTMGTMVGDDGGANQVGVAPGATWIAARGCEASTCSDASLMAASQWMLAPTRTDGSAADPAKRPNIVNNSWGSSPPSNDPLFDDIQQAWADAGIMGVWANGNDGELGCESSGSPGSRTLNYSVGAYDSNNTIAYFSGRGPGQDGEIKPNISAPGVNVRSSFPGDQYASSSGTSMAAPHVAGTVALLWAADPSLVGDVDTTRQLLDDTATDTPDDQCGGTADDNNVYGEGRLDALALVDATDPSSLGTITGTVTHDESGDAIPGVTIRLAAADLVRSTRTGDDGTYTARIPAGDYQATVSAFGYETRTVPISVIAGQTATTDIQLTAMPGFTVSGTVLDKRSGRPIPGTSVTIVGGRHAATTDDTGQFTLEGIPGPARYVLTIDPPGSCAKTIRRSIVADQDLALPTYQLGRYTDQVDHGLEWGLPYGYSCVVEQAEWVGGDTVIEQPPSDDRTPIDLDLPFAFTYFGEQYREISVDTWSSTASFDPDLYHSTVVSAGFPYFRCPDCDETILTRVAGTKPNRTFTVEWRNFFLPPPLGGQPTRRVTVALTLHENGDIVFAYKDLDPNDLEELGRGASVYLSDHSPNGRAASRTFLLYSSQEPVLSDFRQIRFELPSNGFVAGHVVDKATGKPVGNATVNLYNQHGRLLNRKTTNADGTYRMQLMTGRPYSIGVVKAPAYKTPPQTRIELTGDREVRQLTTTLHGARIQTSADSVTLRTGKTSTIRLKNTGDRELGWWASTYEAGSTPPPGSAIDSVDVDASDFSAAFINSVALAEDTWWAAGAVPASLTELDHGNAIGTSIDLGSVAQQLGWSSDQMPWLWPIETAWMPDRGWLCLFPSYLVIETIACVDPATSQVRAEIPTGYENDVAAGRILQPIGLAYDTRLDLFYVTVDDGSWKTTLRVVDGPDHPQPGTVRQTCVLPDDSFGLSYNPTSRSLWTLSRREVTNPQSPYVLLEIETRNCHVASELPVGFVHDVPIYLRPLLQAPEIDEDGNFLIPAFGTTYPETRPATITTMQTSDPVADDIPWLHVSTDSGTLKPKGSQAIRITVDWDAVPDGVTGAKLVFRGNGGANSKVTVPIRLAETKRGTAGADRIVGTAAPETLLGLGGDDTLLGQGGDDRVVGATGDDVLGGGAGADELVGGRGADRITTGDGRDRVEAGAGRDRVNLRRDGVRDVIRCGPGRDQVVYRGHRDRRDELRGCERIIIRP